jgi:hypothetical protein
MSRTQRVVLILVAVVVVVVGFVVLSGGSNDSTDQSTATTASPPTGTGTRTSAATPVPQPVRERIDIRGGKPVGGVKTITARKDEPVLVSVTSPDTTDEVHLHGYDLKRELKAGGRVTFRFTATAEGIFEMELESTATQIAKLVVRPG